MHTATFASVLFLGALFSTSAASLIAQNPLTRPAKAEHPFAGKFQGKDISLELGVDGQGHEYRGSLTFQGQRYACSADGKQDGLQGSFLVGDQSFAFTARLDGGKLQLSSGGTDYELARQDNPLGRGNTPTPMPMPIPPVDGPPAATTGGVGIGFLPNADGALVVKAILPNGPASKTGLKPGGILVAIDGKDIDGASQEQVRAMLQGPVGSLVKLTIDTETEVLDVVIQRGVIPANAPPPVEGNGGLRPRNDLPGKLPGNQPQGNDAPAAAGLPPWLKAGTRITYWSGSASIPGGRSHLVMDDKGNWVDPTSDQRFSDQSTSGAGGMGYQQLNIVYAGADSIAVDARTYVAVDGQPQNVVLAFSTACVGNAQAIGDYWVSPAQLQNLKVGENGGTRILRGPYPLEGRQYDAVFIRSDSAAGFSQYTYDLQTGLCLATSTSSTGGPVATTTGTGAGSTMITHTHLMSVRALQLPWANEALPPGLRTGGGLEYRGTYTTEIPGSPSIPFQFQASVRFDTVANAYVTCKLHTRLDSGMGMPQENDSSLVSAAGMIGSLFVSPRALQQLRQGQVIDEDPITHVRTTVGGMQNGALSIVEQCQNQEMQYSYDLRSGTLVASAQRLKNGIATTVVQLQLAER